MNAVGGRQTGELCDGAIYGRVVGKEEMDDDGDSSSSSSSSSSNPALQRCGALESDNNRTGVSVSIHVNNLDAGHVRTKVDANEPL